MAVNVWNDWTWLKIAEMVQMAEQAWKCLELLKMA